MAELSTSAGSGGTPAAVSERELADLLVRHFQRVWRMARRMGLSPSLAEEAAQDAFMVVLEKRHQIAAGKEIAFLLSTVANIANNLRRRTSVRHENACAPELLEGHATELCTQGLLEQKQARQVVDDILDRLSEPLRVVFVLYELEQFTLREIAEILGIPPNTAGSRLRLARQAFEVALERRIEPRRMSKEEL